MSVSSRPRALLAVAFAASLACGCPAQAQGEYPSVIFNSVPYGGGIADDIAYDPVIGQLYVVDAVTGVTNIYTTSLAFVASIPSPFPAGALVPGITVDSTSGQIFWAVINGVVTELWSAPNPATVATLTGVLALPTPAAVVQGIDCDTGVTNIIHVNDAINGVVSQHDFTGAFLGTSCAAPNGVSLGISHRAGSYVELSADFLGVGVPTHLSAMNTSTCTALDAVGIPIYAPGPPLITATTFDYGPPSLTGAPTLFVYELSTASILHVQTHRSFIRGDANSDCLVNIGDALFALSFLFLGGPAPTCADAADANDDGVLGLGDPLYALFFTFLGGPPPPAPFPGCGQDPTPDALRCDVSCAICP